MAFVKYKLPCPTCGGSDPVALNEDGSGYCFSCGLLHRDYEAATKGEVPITNTKNYTQFQQQTRNNTLSDAEYRPLTDRSIALETAKKYGVKSTIDREGRISKHSYPYYINNEVVATKIRKQDKSFAWEGTPKGTGLFGQQLCREGGKYITLVEGECDAMAAYELLGSQWPVVSVKNGAQGGVNDVKENLEFLESYDTVVINFDNDKVGREAAHNIAKLLTPGKAKIVTLPEEFKDANEMLRLGQHKRYTASWWDAKTYTPSGVMNITDVRAEYKKRERKESIPYPWKGLNSKLEGLRQGELVTLTGGTGLGKSSVTREVEHWLIKNTTDNVGIVALEEDWRRTVDGLLSIEANARLHIDSVRSTFTDNQLDSHFDAVFGGNNKDRVWIHAHLGVTDLDSIFSKLRFMIVGCDCKWVVVDHLHMLVLAANQYDADERKAIDAIMHKLRTLVEETGVGMILVSHLRRVDGNRGHEQGIETGLSHLRGSQSIAQLSDCVISLERNQQSDDIIEASTTTVRVLKSRYTGEVGVATRLLYDKDSGRLSEVDAHDDGDEFLNVSIEL